MRSLMVGFDVGVDFFCHGGVGDEVVEFVVDLAVVVFFGDWDFSEGGGLDGVTVVGAGRRGGIEAGIELTPVLISSVARANSSVCC